MMALSNRIHSNEERDDKFILLLSYARTLTYNGKSSTETAYYTENEDGSLTFHILSGGGQDGWADNSLGEDEGRYYDCNEYDFRNYIGLCAYYGEISAKDWRRMDAFLWNRAKKLPY